MKPTKMIIISLLFIIMLTACGKEDRGMNPVSALKPNHEAAVDTVAIKLSDSGIMVGGKPAETAPENNVYIGNDIIYYEAGMDFTYGEGSEEEAHTAEAAAEHTVVHIAEPGVYSISGSLTKGQIAIDLGEDAEENSEAVVTLILDGVDITCEVAPAIIFYHVYECGPTDTEHAVKDVDTSAAGANVIIADGTTNTIKGSYVARVYKPDSVVLNESGTEVEDAKKLHKYDGAFYSKMSMNIGGEAENSGILTIYAENEGLDSERHLTINGGIIRINSGNDGINTNEDGVSVTTINGGELSIRVTGETGEGDGIDSNGWLVINGGTITAQACSLSADAGIDSDMGIHINGGTVIATGHMLDRIEEGGQNYAVFTFAETQSGSVPIRLNNIGGDSILETCPDNDYSILIYSSPDLTTGTYTMWSGAVQLAGQSGGIMEGQGMPGKMPQGDMPSKPPAVQSPNGIAPAEGQMQDGVMPPELPEGMEPPEGVEWHGRGGPADWPDGPRNPDDRTDRTRQELTTEFEISDGGTMFQGISPAV